MNHAALRTLGGSVVIDRGRIVLAKAQRPRYRLADLLVRCNPKARLTKAEREWLDTPPAGQELL